MQPFFASYSHLEPPLTGDIFPLIPQFDSVLPFCPSPLILYFHLFSHITFRIQHVITSIDSPFVANIPTFGHLKSHRHLGYATPSAMEPLWPPAGAKWPLKSIKNHQNAWNHWKSLQNHWEIDIISDDDDDDDDDEDDDDDADDDDRGIWINCVVPSLIPTEIASCKPNLQQLLRFAEGVVLGRGRAPHNVPSLELSPNAGPVNIIVKKTSISISISSNVL